MADIVNGRCHNDKASLSSPPLFQHGKLVIQMHHIGWLVSGVFTIAATAISFWLMNKHLQWYTNKHEQRYIVRILLMVPLYAIISTSSYLFWNHSTPLLLVRDCYESIVLTSFFYLLLVYISPNPDEQKEVFRKHGFSHFNDRLRVANGEPPRKWMFPLGSIKARPQDGLYFLQMMKWGVLQYCVIRPATTLAAVVLDYVGLYCEDSWSPGWGHLYISVIVSISVSISMYCLIQLYVCVSGFLAPQKPLLKMFAIKAVVFLTFWQATFLSLLATFGFIKDTQYMTAENINIGIGAIAETVEMTLFAILHIKAFSYKPYVAPPQRTKRFKALLHAFNFMETYRELKSSVIYLWHRMRGRETDVMARRQAVLEGVFGKSRIEIRGGLPMASSTEKERIAKTGPDVMAVEVEVQQTVHVQRERQWLGVGDEYGYDWHTHAASPNSEGDLDRTGRHLFAPDQKLVSHDLLNIPLLHEDDFGPRQRTERSWWRNAYQRLSQSDSPSQLEPTSAGTWQSRPHKPSTRRLASVNLSSQTYDDPPPASSIKKYKESRSKLGSHPHLVTAFHPPGKKSDPQLSELPVAVPMQSETSLQSMSDRTDSFLGRVFPPNSNVSHSTEALSGATSSQSHRTQVQLTSGPEMLPSPGGHKSVKRKPVRYSAPDVPFVLPMSARIEEEDLSNPRFEGQPRMLIMSSPSSSGAARREGRGKSIDAIPADIPTRTSLPKRHVPSRDQIVLPAPLAPPPPPHPFSSPTPSGLVYHSHPAMPIRNGLAGTTLAERLPHMRSEAIEPSSTPFDPYHNRRPDRANDVDEVKQIRRSKRTNMRRDSNSHPFVQHPAAYPRSTRRSSAPVGANRTPPSYPAQPATRAPDSPLSPS